MVKAKKYLGQHFLKDETVCQNIANSMSGHLNYNKLIEIGPGTGAITKYLLESDYDLSVVEVDGESITYLREKYPELQHLDPVFWLESIALWAFGISWITKGELILKDDKTDK